MHFVNASVYDLTVEHIEGRFRLMGSHLPEPPVIWSLNIPDAGVLRHGTERSIVIRQWLTSDVAQRLMQTLPANILGEQKFDLRTGEAAIYFSFIDVDGNRKEFRK